MSSGLEPLYKILKDQTRRQIIIQLHEKGSLTYAVLMKVVGITSTGKMNYHLKVLGELIAKTDEGSYTLTEKGKLAFQILTEFESGKSRYQIETQWPTHFVLVAALTSAIYVAGFLAFYFLGIVDFSRMAIGIFVGVLGIITIILAKKAKDIASTWSTRLQMMGNEISRIIFGALVGTVGFMFVGGFLLIGFQRLMQLIGIRFQLFPFIWWVIFSFTVGPAVGAFVAYWLFKRSKQSRISHYEAT